MAGGTSYIHQGKRRIGAVVAWIEAERFLEMRNRLRVVFGGGSPVVCLTGQERIVRGGNTRFLPFEGESLHIGQFYGQGVGNVASDLVLQCEYVGEGAVELSGPLMASAERIDELRIDPQLVAGPLHASFKHVADAEVLGNLFGGYDLALV